MTIDSKLLLRTTGWVMVGVGLYLISLGTEHHETTYNPNRRSNDDILDAEWFEVNN